MVGVGRTNPPNANSLTVITGSGGGNFGAGSILSLTANPAPPGQVFSQWTGASVSNSASPATLFTMPANNATVTAIYSNLPPPNITGMTLIGNTGFSITASALANQPWVLQESTDLSTCGNTRTNFSDAAALLHLTNSFNPAATH